MYNSENFTARKLRAAMVRITKLKAALKRCRNFADSVDELGTGYLWKNAREIVRMIDSLEVK